MHRPTIGIIALVLLIAAVTMSFISDPSADLITFRAACMRVGIVMSAFWLALPQLRRIPQWLLTAVAASAILIAIRPKYALIIVPLVIAYMILRPRKKKEQGG